MILFPEGTRGEPETLGRCTAVWPTAAAPSPAGVHSRGVARTGQGPAAGRPCWCPSAGMWWWGSLAAGRVARQPPRRQGEQQHRRDPHHLGEQGPGDIVPRGTPGRPPLPQRPSEGSRPPPAMASGQAMERQLARHDAHHRRRDARQCRDQSHQPAGSTPSSGRAGAPPAGTTDEAGPEPAGRPAPTQGRPG